MLKLQLIAYLWENVFYRLWAGEMSLFYCKFQRVLYDNFDFILATLTFKALHTGRSPYLEQQLVHLKNINNITQLHP